MNYFSNLSTGFERFNAVYSEICKSIGALTSTFWNGVVSYCPKTLQGKDLVKRIESFLIEKGYDRIVLSKERRGVSIPLDIKRRVEQMEQHLLSLSDACTTAFKVHVIFSHPPTDSQNQLITRALLEKLQQNTLFEREKEAIKRGVGACAEVEAFNAKIKAEYPEGGLSFESLIEILKNQRRDQSIKMGLRGAVHEMGVENIGEWLAQCIGPAPLISQIVKEVGRPIGRFSGVLMSCISSVLFLKGVSHLIGHSRFQDRKKAIQMWVILSCLALDSIDCNPLTALFQAVNEKLLEEVSFYTSALLFGYLGMWSVGTEEALGDYVLNTNRSLVVSKMVTPLFESIGFLLSSMDFIPFSIVGWTLQQRDLIEVFSAHVVYNFKTYEEWTKKGGHLCANAYKRRLLPYAVQFYVDVKLSPFKKKIYSIFMPNLDLEEGPSGLERVIEALKEERWVNPFPFFYRNVHAFFFLIKTPEGKELLQNYRQEILKAIDRSEIEDWTNAPFREEPFDPLEKARSSLFQMIDRKFFFKEEERKRVFNELLFVWNFFKIRDKIFQKLDNFLEKIHLLIPKVNGKEKRCFVYTMETLVLAMIYFNLLKGGKSIGAIGGEGFCESLLNGPALLAELNAFLVESLFPNASSWKAFRLKAIRGGVNLALHVAYPT